MLSSVLMRPMLSHVYTCFKASSTSTRSVCRDARATRASRPTRGHASSAATASRAAKTRSASRGSTILRKDLGNIF